MTNTHRKRIVALGEVVWDIIGGEKHVGGAPFNFAFHASQFGHEAAIVSRVGNDPLGRELLQSVQAMGLTCDHIQVDLSRPTGTVQIEVNLFGEPAFVIPEPAAWDYLAATQAQHDLVRTADVLWFGTLAQRNKVTREAIRQLLETARRARKDVLILCDLNLRRPYYSVEIIRQSLEFSRVMRANEDEWRLMKNMFNRGGASDREFARELMDSFGILLIAVTRASRGCTLYTPDAEVCSPGFVVDVVDTVGAGRAFTAAMVTKLLEGAPFAEVARYGNLAGAYVATQAGPTPRFTPYILHRFELEMEEKSAAS